jgi:hypothetical protein
MNKGVEIILERLKTNPEDFSTYLGSWGNLLSQALESDFITKEEKEVLNSTMIEAKREKFTEKVVKHLLGDEMSAEGKSSVEIMLQNAMLSDGQTLTSSSGGAGNQVWGTMGIGNGGTGASTVIQLGTEVLDEHILRKIKRKLGL